MTPKMIRTALLWGLLAGASALLVLGIVWTSLRLLDIAQTTQTTAEQVSDCLNAHGRCSKAAEARSIETRKTIVYALLCVKHLPYAEEQEILACVERGLARDAERDRAQKQK